MFRTTLRRFWLIFLLVSFTSSARAQEAWQFKFQKGQALNYQSKHATTVVEVSSNAKTTSASNLTLGKRWLVTEVDPQGVATMSLTLTSLRNEQTRPNGEKLLFDSENLEQSTPDLREQMRKHMGQVLAVVKIDRQGKVLEVLQGGAGRFESDLPFTLVLPSRALNEGQAWQRAFVVTLDPPLGTGEKYQAAQTYQVSKLTQDQIVVNLTTEFKSQPMDPGERVPLVQKETQGQAIFDITNGRVLQVRLAVDKTIPNFMGQGTSYHFKSEFSETMVDSK